MRYQFYQNCNFTEVGEPFAEQPLAVAVQQGSHLQKEISKVILELQKERYFETLSGIFLLKCVSTRFYLYVIYIHRKVLVKQPSKHMSSP